MDDLGLKRVVIADWDDGLDILQDRIKPDYLERVFYITLRDKTATTAVKGGRLQLGDSLADYAWSRNVRWMKQGAGDLPGSDKWGLETLFVADSISGAGDAAYNFSLAFLDDDSWRAIGKAMGKQDDYIQQIVGLRCHVILMSHVKYMGGGGEVLIEDKKAGEKGVDVAQIKETDSRIHGKAFPSALGQKLPPEIPRHFNIMLEFTIKNGQRIINTEATDQMALKCPIQLPTLLPQATGVYEIFRLWKAQQPKVEEGK